MDYLDGDGLPFVGTRLTAGNPLYATFDSVSNKTRINRFKSTEDAIIDAVILTGGDTGSSECTKLLIRFRIQRPPVIGDKFSSRHGQKGVCSQKWPAIDMPFSESGIQPDIIINPHAFPSRMTIGMFIESLAGKAGALHGIAQDATPFTFNENYSAADHFGEQLLKAGYSYHGNEPMYSGITGQEFKVDIYLGVKGLMTFLLNLYRWYFTNVFVIWSQINTKFVVRGRFTRLLNSLLKVESVLVGFVSGRWNVIRC